MSVSSAIRFARQANETGHVEVAPRKPRKSRLDAFHDIILNWIAVQTLTFIAGLRHDRLTAPWVIDGPMDGDTFVKYITTQLAPTLARGDVVILDNLPAHKRKEVEKAVKQRGAWLLFLPAYSPDFNPIEKAFAKLKAHLKRMVPRTVTELWKAAGKICDLFTPKECRNFFKADGYGPC